MVNWYNVQTQVLQTANAFDSVTFCQFWNFWSLKCLLNFSCAQAICCYFISWSFVSLAQMIGDSCHCLLYLTYGLVFCPLYLVHTRLCYFQFLTNQLWRKYYLASPITQHAPHLKEQQAQLLKILHLLLISVKSLFPQREEKLLILTMIRSGVSLIRNQKKTVKCGIVDAILTFIARFRIRWQINPSPYFS